MSSALLRIALDALQNPATAPGLRSVTCSTLLCAMDQAVEVPAGSHIACWRYLLGSDQSASALHRHEIPHLEVARDAVRVLLDPEAGETAQDLAMAVLRGSNVGVVTDGDIAALADRVLTEGRSRRVTYVIEQVHEHRGLGPNFLVALRDRLAASDDPTVRGASIDVGALLPRLDEGFTKKMFVDPSPLVRASVADSLERVEQSDVSQALALAREQLGRETHRSVLSALHYCTGGLVRGHRKVKERPAPEGDAN